MRDILAEFSRLLGIRFERGVPTTEDAVRYTFFYALTTMGGLQPHEILLESPHHGIERAQVDTVVPNFRGKCLAIEFKYHRKAPGAGSATPHSQNAGETFGDISRLVSFRGGHETERLLVYVTDSVMAGYFRNPRNGFGGFLDLQGGQKFRIDRAFLSEKCKTFQKAAGEGFEAEITYVFSASFQAGHELRVYEVLPTGP
jgi:hypothetical protein